MSGHMYDAMAKDQLLAELQRLRELNENEKRRSEGLAEQIKHMKEQNIAVQKQVEQEEEYITNKLMKRLEQLKREKVALATEVEQEEEFLTNTLQKRLEKLAKEKVDLENKLEAEQEYIVNKLMKQLDQLNDEKRKLHREKVDLENQLEAEQEYIMNKLQKQVEKLAAEKLNLHKEKSDLQRQVTDMGAAVEKLNKDKVNLENQMEMEEENIVNGLQRQLETLILSYRAVEQKLEARGMSLRELGVQPPDLSTDVGRAYSRGSSSVSSSTLDRMYPGSLPSGSTLTSLLRTSSTGPSPRPTSRGPSTPLSRSGNLPVGGGSPVEAPGSSPTLDHLSGSRRERPLSSASASLSEVYAK